VHNVCIFIGLTYCFCLPLCFCWTYLAVAYLLIIIDTLHGSKPKYCRDWTVKYERYVDHLLARIARPDTYVIL